MHRLSKLLKETPKGIGDLCADPAYLSRNICNMVATLKKTPYVKPKKNTIRNSKGSQSWKKMVSLFKDNQDEFDRHYHRRSLVESVFAVLKIVFGNNLSSRNKLIQKKELALRVICYNIRVVNLMEVRRHVRGRF